MTNELRRVVADEDFMIDWPDGFHAVTLGTEDGVLPKIVVLAPYGAKDEADELATKVIRAMSRASPSPAPAAMAEAKEEVTVAELIEVLPYIVGKPDWVAQRLLARFHITRRASGAQGEG